LKIVLGVADGSIPIWRFLTVDIMVNQLNINTRLFEGLKFAKENGNNTFVDSGGYQILVKRKKIDIKTVIEKYKKIDADYFFSLDIPIYNWSKEMEQMILTNISNYEVLYTNLEDKNIIPVIHLYPYDLMVKAVEKYLEYDPPLIGYGGIVPPMIRKTRLRLKALIGAIILRRLLPGRRIHVLGIGSYIMTRIIKEIGVDSIDTSTWRVKAAYGHVIIPGLGERYVGNRNLKFGTPRIRPNEIRILYNHLVMTKFPFIDKFNDLLNSFKGRAIINAWIITRVNGNISPMSSFYRLYKQIRLYSRYSLEELIKIYERDHL